MNFRAHAPSLKQHRIFPPKIILDDEMKFNKAEMKSFFIIYIAHKGIFKVFLVRVGY